MGSRRKGIEINGWINLEKPPGISSTSALNKLRRLLNAKKAGHGGTLDPLASGILPVALGEATKTITFCQDQLKSYRFKIMWGEARDTDDEEGKVIETSDQRPTSDEIVSILPFFTGEITQLPPKYSAIKIDGQRAYDLAREGKDVEIKPRNVYIQSLDLLEHNEGNAEFRCMCGKGTYMRSLARDIAIKLGTVGYIRDLLRESVGSLSLESAISLAKIEEIIHSPAAGIDFSEFLLPVQTVLDDIPALAINQQEAMRLKNGQKLTFVSRTDIDRLLKAGVDESLEDTALALHESTPIAIVSVNGAQIQPVRVLNL